MQVIRSTSLGLLLGAVLVSSQTTMGGVSISQTCTNTLQKLVLAPEGQCLNLPGLIPLFTIGSDASVIPPINLWLQGLCAVGSCSDETLTSLVDTVLSGCSQDIQQYANVTSDQIDDQVKKIVLEVYPVAREGACLVNNSTTQLCATETLNNLQNITGTLSFNSFNTENINKEVDAITPTQLSSLVCTQCMKQTYNVAYKGFPDVVGEIAGPYANACGATFTDGTPAVNISSIASNTQFVTAKNNNGAVGSHYAPWALLLLGGVFSML